MKTRIPLLLVMSSLVSFGFLPTGHAVSPPPDGGYPGQNTAEGQNALLNLNVNNGTNNTAVGWWALKTNVQGDFNTAIGSGALATNTADGNTAIGGAALFSNTMGDYNTAAGLLALFHNTVGLYNTAVGAFALFNNDSTRNGFATANSAFGMNALYNNTDGSGNSAFGYQTLYSNTIGLFNSAFGVFALQSNTDGLNNSAFGWSALASNIDGSGNTAIGSTALFGNTSGAGNVAVGDVALYFNDSGNFNIAIGGDALAGNTVGSHNTAIGQGTLVPNDGDDNTAVGYLAMNSNTVGSANTAIGSGALIANPGDNNIALGAGAGQNTDGSFNILIGNSGVSGESQAIRIGSDQTDAYISGVYTATATDRPVYIDANGHLGTLSSSRRYKENISAMEKESEALFALKPATFHYKKDPASIRCFGLIAEEVAQVNPDLITHDEHGQPQTVRYEAVNAMLLNEFLKEHRKVEQQQQTIAELKSTAARQQQGIDILTAKLEEQADQIQKMRAQIGIAKPAPRMAANSR
jgi:trimeric autotransporter adhesin